MRATRGRDNGGVRIGHGRGGRRPRRSVAALLLAVAGLALPGPVPVPEPLAPGGAAAVETDVATWSSELLAGEGCPDPEGGTPTALTVDGGNPCRTVQRGTSAAWKILIDGAALPTPVTFSVEGLPAGTTARFGPNPAWLDVATLTVTTSECATTTPLGTYELTVTGESGHVDATLVVHLVVQDGPPRMPAPASSLVSGTTLGSTSTPVKTSWSACNAGPVTSKQAARRSGTATTWTTVSSGSASSITQLLAVGTSHRYRSRAFESTFPAGGPWFYGLELQPRVAQETSSAGVAYTGAWTTVAGSYYSGGHARYANGKGATATFSFTGTSIGWVSRRGPTRGSAQVFVDGQLIRTVDLHDSTFKDRRIVFAKSWPVQGRHTIRIVTLGTAGHPRVDVDAFVTLFQPAAYVKNTWNGRFATQYPNNFTCVAASALTWTNYASGATASEYYDSAIALDWYREVRSSTEDFHNRYDYTGIEPGLDPRGWAWLMWRHAAPGRGYHDYWSNSQAEVNRWIVGHIRDAGEPAGALVFRSIHAMDVVGFSATMDPATGPFTLNGFFIVDPWYPFPAKLQRDGGRLGLVPNTYVSLATWNRSYFLPYVDKPYEAVHGANLWHGDFVAVLRSQDGTREPNKTDDSMPPTYSSAGPVAAPPESGGPELGAMADASGTLAAPDGDALTALVRGLDGHGLVGDARMGLGVGPIELGAGVNVEPATEDILPYTLVEVRQGGRVVALAMLTRTGGGYTFAGLQPVAQGAELGDGDPLEGGDAFLTRAEAARAFAAARIDARTLRAAWRPSPDSLSPFRPFWEATDARGGRHVLTPSGKLLPEIVPATSR
jgi:hypothetical protein